MTLGPPNPWMIFIAKETLGLRGSDFSSDLRLLMPTFSLLSAPANLTIHLQREQDALLPHHRSSLSLVAFPIQNYKWTLILQIYFFAAFKRIHIFRIAVLRAKVRSDDIYGFGILLRPANLRRLLHRIVGCYTLFKGWLLLSQPSICLR